ncbi:folate-binding protein [Paracoccus suum]|uniref:Folate-binding protein n=1 Tax=Paracoccus suum TaxID=2259340 RepID=A0A344PMX1_9RHOB|nr:folate-binding protein YgfZ [Paracoccus suum]AXC50726.1 folate-binding protein [Paracoccus suum]
MTRTVIAIDGPEAGAFLQGLVTNDIHRAEADGIAYAALLTPQGKYLADFFIVARPDGFWLDADEGQAAGLMQRLSMYKLRSNVTLSPAAVSVSRGTGAPPASALPDPRHPALGWRLYGAGDAPGDDGTDWDAVRVAHVIPEAGIELIPNETFILEAGFERLHGVDFRKGCYVGQEVTARMKHKTELRKGLMQVAISGSAPAGTPITRDSREVGTLFTQSGGAAIAQMRYDRMGPDMMADDAAISAVPPG